MFDIIKNVLLPAIKAEIKKGCEDYIEYTLYAKPLDFKPVGCCSGGKRIRVIGPIVTIY